MAVVAVAGGTGNVGRAIVDGLMATKKHKVIILSRKPNSSLEQELGVTILAVDYANIQAVTKILDEHEVDTVISTIMMMPGHSGEEPKEIELIRAADASKTTKRMILSDWGVPHEPEHRSQLGSVIYKEKAAAEAKNVKNLETSRVFTGFFMDFWGVPGVKSHFAPMTMMVDIPNETAAIPGDGNTPAIFTHTTDVARFTAASLDLPKWEPIMHVVGDKVNMNELLHFAEDAKGKKFSVVYDSVEKLKAGNPTELPGQIQAYNFFPKAMYIQFSCIFGLWFAEGVLNYETSKTLNDIFPEIKPLKVKEMIDQAWGKQ